MNSLVSILIAFYSRLLHLYPGIYQEEFAEEMLLDFSDMAMDATRRGIYSLILFCLRELVDFPINLLRIHWRQGHVFMILRSQPAQTGLRGAFGFGIGFAVISIAT